MNTRQIPSREKSVYFTVLTNLIRILLYILHSRMDLILMKKQALLCMLLAGTLMVGGCGQKAADPAADTTAQVTETSDSAPADKPDGAPGENSDRPGNPPDGTPGNMDGNRLLQTEKAVLAAREVRADRIPHRNPTMLSPAFLKIKRKSTRPTLPPERMKVQFL